MFDRLLARVRGLLTRDRARRELDEEIRHHLEMETRANIERGMPAQEARRQALVALGGVEQTRERVGDVHTLWFDALVQDIRFAFRRFGRERAFTATVILTIGLTIGLATTIFSVTNAVLFRPLPYADPNRLVQVGAGYPEDAKPYGLSDPEYHYWLERTRVFDGMAGASFWGGVDLIASSGTLPLNGQKITASLLPLLGVRPILGRAFLPDDELPGGTNVVLLSERLWRTAFGADPAVVGRRIRLRDRWGPDQTYVVVGVTPGTFRLHYATTATAFDARAPRGIDVFTPVARSSVTSKYTASYTTFARLKPGVTVEEARAAVHGLPNAFLREYPRVGVPRRVGMVVPLHEATFGETRHPLLMLIAAVGLVLLIGCTNVASLLLARGDARRQEMALRASLGSGRQRLFRQLLTENLTLAALGGAVGLVLAFWGTRMMAGLIPASLPRGDDAQMDVRVLVVAAALSVLTGLLFGLGPALRASRSDITPALRVGGTRNAGRTTLRHWLVVAQVALVVVLVSAAGLMLNSLWRMTRTDLGFNPRNVLTLQVVYPLDLAPATPRRLALDRALLTQVRSMPGVLKAGTTSDLPFPSGGIIGFQLAAGERPRWAEVFVVDPEYLSLIGLRQVSGRALSSTDDQRGARVAVINQTLAERHFPGVNPLGQRIIVKYAYEIVGVVAGHREMVRRPDQEAGVRAHRLREDDDGPMVSAVSPPAVYLPSAQADWSWFTYLVVRTASDPHALVPRLRRTIAALEPTVSVREAATFEEWMGLTSDAPRFYATVLAVFSLIALLLAAVGIYGVLTQTVGRRVHEIDVRMALGARAGGVAWLVLSRAIVLVVAGAALGLGGAAAVTRTFRVFLFEVSPTDPVTLASVTVVLVVVAAIAAWIPTRRATRVDPLTALRCE